VLTAIVCGNVRFKDILAAIPNLSDKVLAERLRMMQADCLIDRCELPTPHYSLTSHGRDLFAVVYRMSDWGLQHRRKMLG
jgi:DNA-binding HxlR family transcriptional regulator